MFLFNDGVIRLSSFNTLFTPRLDFLKFAKVYCNRNVGNVVRNVGFATVCYASYINFAMSVDV